MIIYKFKVYDPDAGEIDCGYFKTRSLAIIEKNFIEKQIGRKLDREEYEFINIKVIDYIAKRRKINRLQTYKNMI